MNHESNTKKRLSPSNLGNHVKSVVTNTPCYTPKKCQKNSAKVKNQRRKKATMWLSEVPSQDMSDKKMSKIPRKLKDCGQCAFKPFVEVKTINNSTFFDGVTTCGSVWLCPVCSAKKSEKRRHEMNHMLKICRNKQWPIYMLTLTLPHNQYMLLEPLLDKLKVTWKSVQQTKIFRKFRTELIKGTVTATEVTVGNNGWHPHLHIFFICEPHTRMSDFEKLESLWLKALSIREVTGNQYSFQIQDASQIGSYLVKFGSCSKLALTNSQKTKASSRHPFDLLDYNDQKSKKLFQEYALCFHGKRQLVWSRGLKKLAGLDKNVTQTTKSETIIYIIKGEFKTIARNSNGRTDKILDYVKKHGKQAYAKLKQDFMPQAPP